MNNPTETTGPPPGTDPPDRPDPLDYPVDAGTGDVRLGRLRLPRRPRAGARGVLLVHRTAFLVHLLDADDTAGVFRHRDTRPLAGDPGDLDSPTSGDHVVRAAYEHQYDVMAAPWDQGNDPSTDPEPGAVLPAPAGGTLTGVVTEPDPEQAPAPKKRRTPRAKAGS